MRCSFSFIRLWNYLNIYFLKPFDAVNDTITSDLMLKFKWKNNYTEIGSGDGMFSFIMHGNDFPLWFDRYLNVDMTKKNIFEKTENIIFPKFKKKKFKISPKLSLDARKHHINFVKRLNFSKQFKCANYEKFRFKKNFHKQFFIYTPHGLKNYQTILKNISKVLKKNDKVFALVYLKNVNQNFIFYNLAKKSKGKFKKFFSIMDNGRFNEAKKISKNFMEWKKSFSQNRLVIKDYYTGLSPFAWKVYDIQTRPILKILISFFSVIPFFLRRLIKFIWMVFFYPVICLTYIGCSNIRKSYKNENCYIAFELKKY